MTTIAFTASRTILPEQYRILDFALNLISVRSGPSPVYVTGACIGGDQYISTTLREMDPGATQKIIVPADTSRVDEDWLRDITGLPGVHIVRMPRCTNYKDRNLRILEEAGRLVAFPFYPESDARSRRSGSWQTVRMARLREMPVETHILSGYHCAL